MKLKKILLSAFSLVLVAAVAIGGTLAYLTDRDSKANVFTIGNVEIELNEDFEQGSTLIPGVDIKKEATITNTGDNDAWVWLTVLLPEEMGPYTAPDNMSASNNVVHWNLPKESAANITIDFNATPVAVDTNGDGVTESYYQTNLLWKNVLASGDTTDIMLSKVYMDTRVDIDSDGNMYWVVDGVATDLNWNVNEKGEPVIHVSAYAMQTEGFETVEDAYAAYQTQWGSNGAEYAEAAVIVDSVEELRAAVANGGNVVLADNITFTDADPAKPGYKTGLFVNMDTTLDLNGHDLVLGEGNTAAAYSLINVDAATLNIVGDGDLTIKNGTAYIIHAKSGGTVNIYGGNFSGNGHLDQSCLIYTQSNGGVVNIYGGTFTYPENTDNNTMPHNGFNVADKAPEEYHIIIHEGVLLSNDTYRQNAPTKIARIKLADGCTLKEVVIDGTTWYQVVAE